MYYLQSRYYDPEIGRFINADSYASTGQGILGCNMFAYCNNNPVAYSDPNGNARNYCVMLTDSGGKRNPLICRQDVYDHLTYGDASASDTSCGVVATYNALSLKGYRGYENSFPGIMEDFEELGYPLLNGHWGTWPTSIGAYLTRRGVEVSRWVGFGDLDKVTKPGGILIVGWDVYNRHYLNHPSTYASFDDILEDDYLSHVYMIY